ncbi:MAG: hypothetical protein HUJ68_00900 [Clostridia bacterium]|nr:hypothetical protein [Clostridia bacterium]
MNFKIKNVRLSFAIMLVIAFIVFALYFTLILEPISNKVNFANQMIEVSDENETAVFNIQKIILYASAVANDNSNNLSLENLSISQFLDLSIYIDNSQFSSELTTETTIKELYIDNISISGNSDIGTKSLNYKPATSISKFKNIDMPDGNKINFNIVNNNKENESTNYDQPTFYSDCSNPITLGFVNKDFKTNYSASTDANKITFTNAKVLGETGTNLEDLNCTLNFTIHIVNNSNMKFAYNMSFDLNLNKYANDLLNKGSAYDTITTSGNEYRFFKEVQ